MDKPLVRSGVYTIGDAHNPITPVHTVTIATFTVARYAVTNAEYAQFMAEGGYEQSRWWGDSATRWRNSRDVERPPFWDDERFNQAAQPIIGVSWYEAVAYARWWRERTQQAWRLPTEAEWEVAASLYANTQRNTAATGVGRPLMVHANGYEANGVYHWLGNVWVWCSTRWGRNWQSLDYPYPYVAGDGREEDEGSHARVMRGGSWFDSPQEATPVARGRYLPGSRASNIGFRLVCAV